MAQAISINVPAGSTHIVRLGGEERYCNPDTFQLVCDELVARHGGIPRCEPLGGRVDDECDSSAAVLERTFAKHVVAPANPLDTIVVGAMDTVGRDRSAVDEAAAIAAGFSPDQPVFARGSRATGMREHRDDFEALPKTRIAMAQLEDKVLSEERADTTRVVAGMRMNAKGFLLVDVNRDDVPPTHFSVSRRALPALASRIGMPSGAGSYLRDIRPEVRAINFNRWCAEDVVTSDDAVRVEAATRFAAASKAEQKKMEIPPPASVVLRTRKARNDREVFGVVSEGYGAIDADVIARAVGRVSDADTRCHVKYDGFRTQVDVLWFSNITPEHAVAGEFFKAGVRVRTDDTGGGSVRVSAMIWQNLCLNFVIIDEAKQEIDRITHVGNIDKLTKRFELAFKAASARLAHFRSAWGYAVEENVSTAGLAAAIAAGTIEDNFVPQKIEDVIPGFFNGIIERDLVPLPKRNRAQVVGDLMAMWTKDDSGARFNADGSPRPLSRAAVVNAVTRYAHEVNVDPFAQHELEAAAGRLLFGRKGNAPSVLPYLPME